MVWFISQAKVSLVDELIWFGLALSVFMLGEFLFSNQGSKKISHALVKVETGPANYTEYA
jgi:hypothetical protein